jgi:hypothetical protein
MSVAIVDPGDIQSIYRLIHELCEIGSDTLAWRQRMMTQMLDLVGATSSISYAFRFSLDPNDIGPKTLVYSLLGMEDAWRQYLAKGDLTRDPITPHVMSRIGTNFTVSRDEWVDDATWYASAYYREVRRAADFDDTIYSQIAVKDPAVMDGLSFCRKIGEPKFGRREVELVRFLHEELGRLWSRPDPQDDCRQNGSQHAHGALLREGTLRASRSDEPQRVAGAHVRSDPAEFTAIIYAMFTPRSFRYSSPASPHS